MKRQSTSCVYELLDNCFVGHADHGWQLRVYSAVPDGTRTWIQLTLVGIPTYHVLMRMDRSADITDLMWALEQWLTGSRNSTDRIIDVCAAPAADRRQTERRVEWYPVPAQSPLRSSM